MQFAMQLHLSFFPKNITVKEQFEDYISVVRYLSKKKAHRESLSNLADITPYKLNIFS